jgi:two-component system response regulator YesN
VRTYTRQHFTEPGLELDDVAAAIGTSRRQLQRCLQECGGIDFRTFLIRLRMELGRQLLADTDLRVREIAARCAYMQAHQFARTFRRHWGMPPREYRRRERAAERHLAQVAA